MKVIGRISCLSLMMLASVAYTYAQIDPDPDGLGLYFDQGATVVSSTVAEGTESVTAYLILTNPSVGGSLVHWSASVSAVCGGSGNAMVTGLPTEGFNLALNMPGSDHWVFEVSVAPETPFPATTITVLAVITIWPNRYDIPINLCVAPGSEFGGYGADSGGAEFQPSSGSWEMPAATINGQAPVEVIPSSWGRVKSVFR